MLSPGSGKRGLADLDLCFEPIPKLGLSEGNTESEMPGNHSGVALCPVYGFRTSEPAGF